ncbi:uncharacterized protein [Littorina saxatilis]|uniref:uncharacterized protein n=1 Tax=Littorina saxatilis TaxID=31220 RepID=UPI0038B5C295
MAFTFVLVLSALAAYAQAVPTYGSGRLSSSRLSPVLGLGGRAVGSGLVAPIHNGHLGHGGGFNRYDASGRIQDSVYNRGRLGGSGLGLGLVGGGAGNQQCMYLEYPRRCETSRGSGNSIMRATFVDGRCQRFYCSSRCFPDGINNNIFRTIYDCQQYCGL